MPVNDIKNKRSLHIHICDALNDNDENRVFKDTGEHVIHKSHQGGLFTDAFEVAQDINTGGVRAGHGRGFVSFTLKDSADQIARDTIEKLRQTGREVITIYRQYELFNGKWVNTKTVETAGYICSADLKAGGGSISIEAHINNTITQNEQQGRDEYQVDCVNGTTTTQGGDLGPRTLQLINCPGDAINEQWEGPIT